MTQAIFRPGIESDAPAIHGLIEDNLALGHLLPRSLDDVRSHAPRFIVAEAEGRVIACAELAPLSASVAEVRSLVVETAARGRQIGPTLVAELASGAIARGFSTLCAFTHDPSHFVRLGFSIVPHVWVPEKITHDCTVCPQFRRCGQYAVTLALKPGVQIRPERPAAVIYAGRVAAAPRPNVERLHLYRPAAPARAREGERREAVPA